MKKCTNNLSTFQVQFTKKCFHYNRLYVNNKGVESDKVKTEKSNFNLCKYSMKFLKMTLKFLKMTLMFLKNIGLIEKNIRTFEDKHTVD